MALKRHVRGNWPILPSLPRAALGAGCAKLGGEPAPKPRLFAGEVQK
jgi:hypothetical protein